MTEHPVTPIPREARPYQGQAAGLVTRLLAGAVDSLVIGVTSLAGYLGWHATRFLIHPRGFELSGTAPLPTLVLVLGVAVAYLSLTWGLLGRSYGGHVMGLRVIGSRSRGVGPLQALVRAVAYVVFPVGLAWCGVSRTRRSVQDILVRTRVVYDWRPRHYPTTPAAVTAPP